MQFWSIHSYHWAKEGTLDINTALSRALEDNATRQQISSNDGRPQDRWRGKNTESIPRHQDFYWKAT